MTAKSTQDEWVAIFDDAEQTLPGISPVCRAPTIGSAAFARTIDHTILKLEASQEDIDRLCAEARKYVFKVRQDIHQNSPENIIEFRLDNDSLHIVCLRTTRVGSPCC